MNKGDHYIEGVSGTNEYVLYWITSRITLKEFKQAIGADTVWRCRLKFFDKIIEKQNNVEFTEEDLILIEEYRNK